MDSHDPKFSFSTSKRTIDFSSKLILNKSSKINALAQAVMGNPAESWTLFKDFLYGKFKNWGNWNILELNKDASRKTILEINKAIIDPKKETFELNKIWKCTSIRIDKKML